MHTLLKIIKYQLQDISRNKWLLIYTIFFFVFSYSIFLYGENFTKVIISMMNLILLIIPLVSIIFGTIYLYNNKEYIIFMLSQPIRREILFLGLYIGIVLPLIISFLLGAGIPLIFFINKFEIDFLLLSLFFTIGILQTLIFSSLSFLISTFKDNRLLGLSLSLFIWLFLTVIYDGLILFILNHFQDYPLEKISLLISFLNPIDLARIIIMLKLDIAALMGYTGALFQKFFSNSLGLIFALMMMLIWSIIPFVIGIKKFIKKDF
ncbi:ABC transporter permease subunit [Rosettibacter firmus]|uniref:ABC transporter permease subunit n=1 Tax=Rosettibacter firmus TaxID=3111522 RepID=UPI00336BC769